MFCRNCGKKVNDNSCFCGNCGAPLKLKTNSNKKNNAKFNLIIGFIAMLIFTGITIGTFFYFGPFFGIPGLFIFSILEFNEIFSKLKKSIKYIISTLISIIICAIVIKISFNIWTPKYVSKEDAINYLKETYALTNINLVDEKSGDWGEYYTYYFTAEDLNDNVFFVETKFASNKEKVFVDNYITIKYSEKLENQYSDYFDKIIDQDFKISIEVVKEFYNSSLPFCSELYNTPLISYEEYINLLSEKNLSLVIESNVELNENSITQIKEDIKDVIYFNELNNVSNVEFRSDCHKDEYFVSCNKIIELYNK